MHVSIRKLRKNKGAGDLQNLPYPELVKKASEAGVFRVGMTKAEIVAALS